METLGDKARKLYGENKSDQLFKLADESWPTPTECLPEGQKIAELCRFTMIRYQELGRLVDADLWHARGMVAALMQRSSITGSGLLLRHVFRMVDVVKEGRADSTPENYRKMSDVLDEILRLTPEGSLEWKILAGRLYRDKRAIPFLMEATCNGGRPQPGKKFLLEQARETYEEALECLGPEPVRERCKVRGGIVLVEYLLSAYVEDPDEAKRIRESALGATEEILEEARTVGAKDVVVWAEENVAVMRRGAFEGWSPYEVL